MAKAVKVDTEMGIVARLAGEKKVAIVIPPRDPKDTMWYGMINEVNLSYPKGEVVYVPESVAKHIQFSLDIDKQTELYSKANRSVQK